MRDPHLGVPPPHQQRVLKHSIVLEDDGPRRQQILAGSFTGHATRQRRKASPRTLTAKAPRDVRAASLLERVTHRSARRIGLEAHGRALFSICRLGAQFEDRAVLSYDPTDRELFATGPLRTDR